MGILIEIIYLVGRLIHEAIQEAKADEYARNHIKKY